MRITMIRMFGALAVVTIGGLLLSGCSSMGGAAVGGGAGSALGAVEGSNIEVVATLPPPLNSGGGTQLSLSPSDVINVDVFGVDDLDRTAQIDASGNVTLPLIGAIRAAGLTQAELEVSIKRQYNARFLRNAEVSVFVQESAGQRVTVDGEVSKTGIYGVTNQSTLVQVLAEAGGLNDIADPENVYVFRDFGTQRLVAQYDVSAIRSGNADNPRIFGGDVVVVFASGLRVAGQQLREALGVAGSVTRFGL